MFFLRNVQNFFQPYYALSRKCFQVSSNEAQEDGFFEIFPRTVDMKMHHVVDYFWSDWSRF